MNVHAEKINVSLTITIEKHSIKSKSDAKIK